MSKHKESSGDGVGLALIVVAPVAFVMLLWLCRFIPLFAGGLFIGGVTLFGTFYPVSTAKRIRVGALNYLFFVIVIFVLVGAPWDGLRSGFKGLLMASGAFKKWLGSVVIGWNAWIPAWSKKYVAWQTPYALEIVRYFWGALGIGLFTLGFGLFRSKPFSSGKALGSRIGRFLASAPAQLLNRIFFLDRFLGPLFSASDGVVSPGFRVGISAEGAPFELTERNLQYHVEIVAPTGGGKTNLIKNLIYNRIRLGHGVIFMDYKADFEFIEWLCEVAKEFGRGDQIRFLSLSDPAISLPYNPFLHGDANDIHSALMNAMIWSEPFYRSVSSDCLLILLHGLVEYRTKTGEFFHIGHIHALLDDSRLLASFALRLQNLNCSCGDRVGALAATLQNPMEKKNLKGLIANLNQILLSSAGGLLSSDVISGSFDFRDSIPKGEIVIMLMNSLKLQESASMLGKVILQDLMSYVGGYYGSHEKVTTNPIALIIDEFAGFATAQFIQFMDRARGARIGIVFAHQARADLREVSLEFQERMEANSNTVLVTGVKNPEDAEFYASILGTQTGQKDTLQVQEGFFGDSATGGKSRRDVEEFLLHPNKIKNLKQGELLAISRTVDPRWGLVRVPQAKVLNSDPGRTDAVLGKLKEIRQRFLNRKGIRYLDLRTLQIPSQPRPETKAKDDAKW